MIQIPLEIGDIILAGRFKNKKIKVKDIGVDDYGLPTVNGRGIMKIRIQKLIKPKVEENIVKGQLKENDVAFDIGPTKPCRIKKEDGTYWIYRVNNRDNSEICASNTGYESKESAERAAQLKGYVMVDAKGNVQEYEFAKVSKNADARSADYKPKQNKIEYIEEIVRKIVRESKVSGKEKLNEVDLTGSELEAKAKRYAELANKMKMLESELKTMETEYDELDAVIRPLLESVGTTKDTFIRAGKLLIKIERAGYEKKSRSYKTGFEYLWNKVNGTMKDLADEALKMTEGVTTIKSKISVVQSESVIKESSIWNKVSGWFKSIYKKLYNTNNTANASLDELENALQGQ